MRDSEIAILLSSYNGEKYISDQIESIINQSYNNWKLYIRDDGSTDSTLKIVQNFISIDVRIILLKDDVQHRGVKESFLWLLRHVESDYYMFCDQDDVWEVDKVRESYLACNRFNNNDSILVCTDLSLVDSNLELINHSMWKTHHLKKLVDNPKGLVIASMFPGCTMFFNRKVRDLALKEIYNFTLHDLLISMVTYKNKGRVIAIHKPLIKYRQHSNNVVGLYTGSHWFLNKLKHLYGCFKCINAYYTMVNTYLGISKRKFYYLKICHILNII